MTAGASCEVAAAGSTENRGPAHREDAPALRWDVAQIFRGRAHRKMVWSIMPRGVKRFSDGRALQVAEIDRDGSGLFQAGPLAL